MVRKLCGLPKSELTASQGHILMCNTFMTFPTELKSNGDILARLGQSVRYWPAEANM